MNHWAFVTAAYAIAILATTALLIGAFVAMRRAEAEADQLRGSE